MPFKETPPSFRVEQSNTEAERLIEEQRLETLWKTEGLMAVIRQQNSFETLTHTDIIKFLIDNGEFSILVFYSNFAEVDDGEVVEHLFAKRLGWVLAKYIGRFKNVDNDSIAEKIIAMKQGGALMKNIIRFNLEKLSYDAIAERLMYTGQGEVLAKHIGRFKDSNQDAIAEGLMRAGQEEALAKYINKFKHLNHTAIAEKYIAMGQEEVLVKYFHNFKGLDPHIQERLIHHPGMIKNIIANLEKRHSGPWVENLIKGVSQYVFLAESFIDAYHSTTDKAVWKSELWVSEARTKAEHLMGRVQQEAVERRDKMLENEKLFTLSKEEFQKYFPLSQEKGTAIAQSTNVANCFLIASLDAAQRWPHFEMVCRTSVKRNPDGSWQVKIPLANRESVFGEKEQHEVIITPKELEADYGGLLPLTGPEGYQVLEAAYLKAYHDWVDRNKSTVGAGGLMHVDSLFGKESFVYLSDNRFHSNEIFLEIFDPHIHLANIAVSGDRDAIAICSVNFKTKEKEKENVKLFLNHVYSVFDVDEEKEVVYFINPHNTTELLQVDFDMFIKHFSVALVRTDNTNLLQNIEELEKIA